MTYDFCILGGGMVGSAMARAVSAMGHRVAWISGPTPEAYKPEDQPDVRMAAITAGSISFLDSMGAWEPILALRTNPYTQLSTWEGNFSPTTFTAAELGTDYLGHFVENRLVQLGCEMGLADRHNLTRIADAKVTDIKTSLDQSVTLTLDKGDQIQANWLIGADGGRSLAREKAGIATQGWQYAQQAMGVVVELEQNSGQETWQMFLPSGPRALLPMYENYAALIWYDAPDKLQELMKLANGQLIEKFKQAFGPRLPIIKQILGKAQFPLTAMHARHYVSGNTILVGDAAHTVNPLAGQGVNMGFGDAQCLASVLQTYQTSRPFELAFKHALKTDYESVQRRKNSTMMLALDAIYGAFKIDNPIASLVRQSGLFLAQRSGPLKKLVLQRAAGLFE